MSHVKITIKQKKKKENDKKDHVKKKKNCVRATPMEVNLFQALLQIGFRVT
jgi:hypothetical protein